MNVISVKCTLREAVLKPEQQQGSKEFSVL